VRVERIGEAVLYQADCREVLPTLGRVAAVVTDPPYGIGETSARNSTRAKPMGTAGGERNTTGRIIEVRDYGDDAWDREPCPPEVLAWMRANSAWQIIFGGNHLHELVATEAGPARVGLPPSACWLVWDKENSGDFADAELAWTNLKGAVRLKRHMWNGMLRKGREPRFHLTQKPLDVMAWALSHLPDLGGGVVLDPFMGSGTTGVACVGAGLPFIGIEREAHHFDTACRRIGEALTQPRLFEPQRPPPPVQPVLFAGGDDA
jgi:DNA modification methylase